MYLDNIFDRVAHSQGKEYLFFSGYDYLSVHTHPKFKQLIAEGLEKFGWCYASSRITNTQIKVYEECESLLCAITGKEETVLFNSGFTAGQSVSSLFQGKLVHAPYAHPAIRQAGSIDLAQENWEKETLSLIAHSDAAITIAGDALNPFSVQINDYTFLNAAHHEARLIIDDSHGIGITQNVEKLLPDSTFVQKIFTYSMGKAYGVIAGAVSCDIETAKKLRNLPTYAAVTPPAPGPLYAFVQGQDVYAEQLEKLRSNLAYIQSLLKDCKGVKFHPSIPAILLPSDISEKDFFDMGCIISSFAYPDPKGPRLNRLVINAAHTKTDLEKVVEILYRMI